MACYSWKVTRGWRVGGPENRRREDRVWGLIPYPSPELSKARGIGLGVKDARFSAGRSRVRVPHALLFAGVAEMEACSIALRNGLGAARRFLDAKALVRSQVPQPPHQPTFRGGVNGSPTSSGLVSPGSSPGLGASRGDRHGTRWVDRVWKGARLLTEGRPWFCQGRGGSNPPPTAGTTRQVRTWM